MRHFFQISNTVHFSYFRTKRVRFTAYHFRHLGYHSYLVFWGILSQIHATQFSLVSLPSVSYQSCGIDLHDGGNSNWEVLGSLLASQLPPNEHGLSDAVHLLRCTSNCGSYCSQCSEVFRVGIRMEVRNLTLPFLVILVQYNHNCELLTQQYVVKG